MKISFFWFPKQFALEETQIKSFMQVFPVPLCFLCEIMKEKVTECFQARGLCEGGEREAEKGKTKASSP